MLMPCLQHPLISQPDSHDGECTSPVMPLNSPTLRTVHGSSLPGTQAARESLCPQTRLERLSQAHTLIYTTCTPRISSLVTQLTCHRLK